MMKIKIMLILLLFCSGQVLFYAHAGENKDPATGEAYPAFANFLLKQVTADWEAWKKTGDPSLYHRALFNIDQATAIAPESAEIWFVQGMLYLEMKNTPQAYEKALSSFLRAVAANPYHGRAQLMLAQTLTRLQKFDLAIEQYQFLLQDPNMVNSLVLNPLAACYIAAGRTGDGVVFFKALKKQHLTVPDIRFCLAVLLKQADQPKEAIKTLKSILENNLGSKETQAYAGNLLKTWGDAS